jgi:hypothetical protein
VPDAKNDDVLFANGEEHSMSGAAANSKVELANGKGPDVLFVGKRVHKRRALKAAECVQECRCTTDSLALPNDWLPTNRAAL